MYEVLFEIENVTKDMPIEEIETKCYIINT